MAHSIPNKVFLGGSIPALKTHVNAPVRSVGAGSTITVLNKCLIDGFGEVTLSSLTINSSGIATAVSNSHGYLKVYTVVLISGADQEAANGEWYITEITDSNTLKIDMADSGLSSTTITGAEIKMMVAPLGWSKPFEDVPNSVAVYQSLSGFSRRNFLRVDDSDNQPVISSGSTFFRGYELMSSALDDGIYPFPPKSAILKGICLKKSLINSVYGNYFPSNRNRYIMDYSWVTKSYLFFFLLLF